MAIEASKFTEKDELIAKFYTLRAGLSVIAEETEKIKTAETEFDKVKKEIESALSQKQEELVQLERNLNWWDNRLNDYKKEKEKAKKENAGFGSFILGCIIVYVFLGLCYGTAILFDYAAPFVLFFIPAGGLGLNRIITAIRRNEKAAPIDKEIEKAEKEIQTILEKTVFLEIQIEHLQEKSADAHLAVVRNLVEAEFQLQNKVIPQSTAIAQSTREAMLQTSKGILNESDWQNIDLLIFYLETGRADSLKEALQLVDKQRQTDQVTRAIHEATNHISIVINAGFNRLGALMSNCFFELGRQIQFNHNETINTMLTSFANLESSIDAGNRATQDNLKNLNKTLKTEGDRIANAEQLNASLLKKANESSDKLMDELRYNQKYWNR